MAQGNVERQEKDKQRKLEIQRQEQLLSGRIQRAKTEEHGDPSGRGPGIQIYHYKDPGEQWQNLLLTSVIGQSGRLTLKDGGSNLGTVQFLNLMNGKQQTNIQFCHPPSISMAKQAKTTFTFQRWSRL